MSKTHIMVDIETLDTAPAAHILSTGVVTMFENNPRDFSYGIGEGCAVVINQRRCKGGIRE